MLEQWLMAVRDHPERPPAMQRHVLTQLGLRLDWYSRTGYASTGQLAADADVTERTVKRATAWARQYELLERTRRGHRLGNGQVVASEWKLILPESQGVPEDTLSSQGDREGTLKISRGQRRHLKGTAAHPHQESSTSSTTRSALARASSGGETPALNGAGNPPEEHKPATPEQYQAGAAAARAALTSPKISSEEKDE